MKAIDEVQTVADAAVTVVMPCYNAASTIEASIESVRAQTFRYWRLIVVDDGSSDIGPAMVAAMATADPRIQLVRQTNAGPSAARNRGVALSHSEFIAFLDADDVWAPEHLALTVDELVGDARLGVAFGPCRILDEAGRPTGEQTRALLRDVSRQDILASNPTATCSALVIRRDAFVAAGPMRIDMVHAEDQEWLFRVLEAGWSIRGIGPATVGYRTSPSGLSADVAKMQAGWETFMAHARAIAPDLDRRQIDRARAAMQLYYARRCLRTGRCGAEVRHHLANALRASPRIVCERPSQVLAIVLGSLAPSLIEIILSLRRSLRHA